VAVPLLVAIAAVLAWGTIYETRFGTVAVQRAVYQSRWFQTILGFLAVNLAVAAFKRYPWKRAHAPFVLAHLGIIAILLGGIIGGRFGIEGQLIIPEGQAEKLLQLPHDVLVVHHHASDTTEVLRTEFETRAWVQEPNRTFVVPIGSQVVHLTVDRYAPDAQLTEEIVGDGTEDNPAVQVHLSHETQEDTVWLLANDPERFGGDGKRDTCCSWRPQPVRSLISFWDASRAPGIRAGSYRCGCQTSLATTIFRCRSGSGSRWGSAAPRT
jgi:hypothetical protein